MLEIVLGVVVVLATLIGVYAFTRGVSSGRGHVVAKWNGETIAESSDFEKADGQIYFPPETVKKELLQPSDHTTECWWKGTAHYYHVVIDGKTNENAAWSYTDPKERASELKDHVAFWNGVEVTQQQPK